MSVLTMLSTGLFRFIGTGLEIARSNRERSVAANWPARRWTASA